MAQSNFEENSEIEELHIEPTDVMIRRQKQKQISAVSVKA